LKGNPDIAQHGFQKGESGNPNGRPRKYVTTLAANGYKRSEINDTIQAMMAMTIEELKGVYENPSATILEKTIAGAMRKSLEKGTLSIRWKPCSPGSTVSPSKKSPLMSKSSSLYSMTELIHGDCLEVLRSMPDCSVDAVVTDPPYGLSFMGKKWDYDVPSVEVWAECLRVLKPGGHLLAFAGTRTQHRMAVRIEDAGFEIRDMIAWVYGAGFPKSHNLKNVFCNCGVPHPKDHYICNNGTEENTEQHLRPLRESDLQKAELPKKERGEILHEGLQEQSSH